MILFDLTRGLAQRVEGQLCRHWAFVPALFNLYFREQINTGISLKSVVKADASQPVDIRDEDPALVAADLYQKLATGTYTDQQNKRGKIAGDTTKLLRADGLSSVQRRLLADFRFRTKAVPSAQEI